MFMNIFTRLVVLFLLACFIASPVFSQEQTFTEKEYKELLEKEVIGGVPAEKADNTRELFVEAKPAEEALELIGKKEIETLPEYYKSDNAIFERFIYAQKPLPGGIDHLAAGVATRNSGFGNIRLRGLPPGAVTVYAALYFGTIYGPGQAIPIALPVVFKGKVVTARLIGTAAQPCWVGNGKFAAYRAFVTPYVSGNTDYLVQRLPSFLTDGRDPWTAYNNTTPLSEGASLVVLYSHSTVPSNSYVQINHVNQMFYSSLSVMHYLPRPINGNSALKHTRLGADGQAGFSLSHFNSVTDELTFINGTQIKGTGSSLNKDSDWNGYDGEPLNQLWDTHTMNIPYSIPNGATYYYVRYKSRGDCIIPVVHVLTARY
jgi:hypothetical protein